MIEPLKIASSHEELFADRYQRLLVWSLQLTGNERDLAEDLLHDAYVQFTFTQPDLSAIKNLDGYFYGMLRNLHISHLRRETRNRWQQLSVVEYDSAEDGLRTTDLRDQLHVQDELRSVCHYVCVRKETARAASILILRFFHGYYPTEIVQLLRTSRQAVDVQLLIARREARLSFENPAALSFMSSAKVVEIFPATSARPTDDFLNELRQMIFQSKRGACLSRRQLRDFYSVTNDNPMECGHLAHMVSCPSCLDEVNRMLGLPLLSERNPTETLGRDNRPKGPGAGGSKGGGAGIGSWRRRARRVFEHKPQELCVAVNGYVQASQPVNSELSELNLNIDLSEEISFVEVFSEQKLRLLMLSVDDLPPAGPGERAQLIQMSDGRTLGLKLEFRSPWPTLQVAYHDPTYKEVQELLDSSTSEEAALPLVLNSAIDNGPMFESGRDVGLMTRLRLALFGRGLFLRPATITAILALLFISAFLLSRWHANRPPLTAVDLLQQAAVAEQTAAARTDTVLHRMITVEEYKVGQAVSLSSEASQSTSGELIARHRVEVWHGGEKGITARRFFDDQNNLMAGEWDRADGRTFYHHGSKPEKRAIGTSNTPLSFESAWQLDLSAKNFQALVGSDEKIRVEENADRYVFTYDAAPKQIRASDSTQGNDTTDRRTGFVSTALQSSSRGDDVKIAQGFNPGSQPPNVSEPRRGDRMSKPNAGAQSATLLKATLTLSRADLHAIEETLTLQQGGEVREFRLIETSFERRPPSAVAPSVFEPEPELLSSSAPETLNSKLEPAAGAPSALAASPVAATTELEVEVLRLINQSGADLGDQVNVRRTPEGQLLVQGIVETDRRKDEILRALAPVAGNPAVKLKVQTVAEALKRQNPERQRGGSDSVTVERLESSGTKIPADAELRRYFAAKGLSGSQLDQAVNQFAGRMVERSLQALRHAGALDRLSQRFSLEQLRTLDPDARTKWLGLLRSHAQALERELSGLHRDLGPFVSSEVPSGAEESINSDQDLQQAIHRLFELCSATDQAVRSSFTISASGSSAVAVKSPQFFRSLTGAEALVKSIQAASSR